MRRPLDSPFSPGSDTVPQVWAGRSLQLADFNDILRPRRLVGAEERGRTVLGEPGSGKSALVRRIAAQAQAQGDWVTPQLRIPSGSDPLKRVAEGLLGLADVANLPTRRERALTDVLRRVETVAVKGVSLSMRDPGDGPEPYRALTDLLVSLGKVAVPDGRLVLVHVDEVQNIGNDQIRSQLLIALGDALTSTVELAAPGGVRISRGLPLAVYLSGLPEFADMAGGRAGATFARRFQSTTLEALDDEDLFLALHPFVARGWEVVRPDGSVDRVRMTPQAQAAIIDRACGEPFLFQLAGERAWFASSDDVITEEDVEVGWRGATGEAESHVQRIVDGLPERERQFLDAMSQLAPEERTLTNIAHEMGLASAMAAGPTSRRLDLTRGIVRRGSPYSFKSRAVEAYLTSEWPRF